MLSHRQRESGFSDARRSADNHHRPALKSVRHVVQVAKAGAEVQDGAAGLTTRFGFHHYVASYAGNVAPVGFAASGADSRQLLFGLAQLFIYGFFAVPCARHYGIAERNQPTFTGRVTHHADVVFDIREPRYAVE